jgi:uncharacterized protein (TIGR04222 family)
VRDRIALPEVVVGDTWGIPGPVFLGLFVVLAVVAWLVGPLARWSLDRRAARAAGGARVTPSVEELALLAGGRKRLIETAIARLVDGGVLRISHQRHLTPTGRPPVGDLDEAVVGAVESHPAMSTNGVLLRVHHGAAVRAIEDGARAKGLLHDPAAVRRSKHLAVGALGLVELLGVLRLAAGIARGASVAFLVVLIVLVGVLTLVTLVAVPLHRPTPRGRETLARHRSPTMAPAGGVSGTATAGAFGVAGLVALGGFAMFPDPQVASLLAAPSFGGGGSDSGGSDSGGDSGSSCGSSCGGGGGCGG